MLDLNKFLTEIRSAGRQIPVMNRLVLALQQLQDGVNQVGTATGTDPNSHTAQPDPPTNINVKAANGLVHVTLNDMSQRSRALHYFVEADTNPAFPQPHVFHLGASRGLFTTLPAMDDNSNPQSWYFRTYSMQLGSEQRSAHQVFGGTATPTPVSVGGLTTLTPLTSTGAGTAPTNGQRGGQGFGSAQFSILPPNVPKAP